MERWTQARMREVAQEERLELGLAVTDRLNPYELADRHGIAVYELTELLEWDLSEEAWRHFVADTTGGWSAALVPFGHVRVIVENDRHTPTRRRASIAHELGHHLLEHLFDGVLLGDDHRRAYDTTKEKHATFLAGELLVPERAAFQAARAGWSNVQVAEAYGVSEQFAQMQMKGPRVVTQRAAEKARRQ